MAYNFVQSNVNAVFSDTTVTVSPTSPFTAGNAILILWKIAPSTLSLASISDGVNTYVIGPQSTTGNNVTVGYAYALSILSGTPTITLTVTGGTFGDGRIVIEEWSGIGSSDSGQGSAAATGGTGLSGQNYNSGSFTTTTNGDLIWGATFCPENGSMNPGPGFTGNVSVPGFSYESEFLVQSNAGSISATFSTAATGMLDLFAVAAAFQPIPPPPTPDGITLAWTEW